MAGAKRPQKVRGSKLHIGGFLGEQKDIIERFHPFSVRSIACYSKEII